MADTFIKRPVLYKGTKAQIESATMGENDFAVATDVEFYTKEEINSLLGEGTTFEVQVVNSLPATGAKGVIYLVPKDGAAPDVHDEYVWIESTSTFELIGTTQIDLTNYATKTELNTKQDKLIATGTLSLPVYYDGTRLKEVTRLRAEMVSGGFDGEIYYAHHPEMSNMHIIPFIYNDFAFIDKKGGSYTVTRSDNGEINNPQNIFDAAPSYMLSRGFASDTVWTVEISTPKTFTYTTLLYVDFGASGFFCSYIKVEAQHSGTGEWETILEKTDNSLSYVYCKCRSDDVGMNKFRFTFKNPTSSVQFRLSSIGAISFKSAGVEETMLTLKGGTVFGDVIAPNITNIQNETTSIKGTLDGKVNIAQGAENAGKILTIDNDGNVVVGEGGGASLPILMSMWSDRVINDMSWLRADTFSWHTGDVYVAAYQHLVSDINNGKLYAWNNGVGTIYTRKLSVVAQDNVYNSAGEKIAYVKYTGDGYIAYDNVPENYFYRAESSDITGVAPEQATDTIGDTTITYYQADDGHKICLPDQESNLAALYEATGVAWYYVLDTTNKQFKLPRTKWGFTGLRDSVGGYVEAGLPNISGTFMAAAFNYTTGHVYDNLSGAFSVINAANAAYGGGGGANNSLAHFQFNASKSNETYGASDTVQPPATQMYLYFYVGNFEQSAIEQTAGITSETLNQKADIDGGNCSANFAKFGMPSEIYTNLTLGSSGSRYTAPADGWFALGKTGNSGQMINMENQLDGSSSQTMGSRIYSAASSVELKIYLPARKGDVVYVSYTASGTTNFFRFIYAEGAKHLA